VWPRLRKHVAVEREQLRRLLADHSPLLAKCATGTPHWIEVSALAVMLHSFYSGVENIYPFQLKWERMSSLVLDCPQVLRMLGGELDAFLKATESKE